VPNWSGLGERIYSQIAPGDSFVAEFVPPRAGTFPYHSHFNDRHQINSGMYGAILVTDRKRDPTHDHLIVTGGGGPAVEHKFESPYALVNGRRTPEPLRLTVGETHRLRFVTIHPDWEIQYTLRNDSTTARWRAVAKDGADLPRALATRRLAQVVMGPGETADFEWTPTVPGTWRIDVASAGPGWQIPLEVIVEPRTPRKP
jgi:FtsP/CotA-like multicopper oxidase with cupredoxin domain